MSCGTPCEQKTVRWVAHGAAGLAKAVLRIDRAPDSVVAARRDLCRTCEHSTKHPTRKTKTGLPLVNQCTKCHGCLIRAKTANAGEECPVGKWEKIGSAQEKALTI